MPKPLSRVLGVVLALGLSWGFARFVGDIHRKQLAETRQALDSADPSVATVGPLTVDHSTCRYLLPSGTLNRTTNGLICPRCVEEAAALRERFTPAVQEGRCGKRGRNTIVFQRRQ